MATKTKSAPKSKAVAAKPEVTKADIYETITNKIVAKLEGGTIPWMKPWGSGNVGSSSRPLRACGTPYSGINILQLWIVAEEMGYESATWMTYNQAQEFGGQVRKGEKATQVVFASTFNKEETQDDGSKKDKAIPFLKTYCVFNVEQIDGASREIPSRR